LREFTPDSTLFLLARALLIVALLHHYPFHATTRAGQICRGQLVVELLRGDGSAAECMEHLKSLDRSVYQGFLLFALGREKGPVMAVERRA
jgi:hypothetical protein